MTSYAVLKVLNEGLVGVTSTFGRQLFSIRVARKKSTCIDCTMVIVKGQQCWGEITSCAANRMHRLCTLCMEQQMGKLSNDPDFNELVRKAMEKFESLTPQEKAAHRQAQRESWVYGQLRLSGRDVTRESVRAAIKKHDEENPN